MVSRLVSVMWVQTTSLLMRFLMSSLRLSPVRSALQRKMANGGGGSSDYESFEEEEEEEPHPPPTPPPAIPRSKGAVKSAARPPAPRGAARSAAGVKVEAPSSPSVSPAPARREARKAETDSTPLAASAKAAPPERRPRVPAPAVAAHPEKRSRVRGRRAWGSQICDICWNEVGGFPSALDQHRRWNLECLRWQHYNEGDCSWEEARDRAMQTKMRRDARAIVEQSRTREEPSAGGNKHWPRDDLRDRTAHMGRSAPESVIVKVHEKKKKKRRSHKRKRDEDESPTPEVPERDRRRRDRPPSSSDEEPRASKRPRRRQLVITLPDHLRF